jgi:hypothetical protein
MFQQVTVMNAYPRDQYTSFTNIDFGTVKGLTLTYDLRRTNNVSVNAAYTLQFADGTGSTSGSANNLLQSGESNILIPVPLNYDQRHTVVATVDYRYGSGTDYSGPANLRNIFENSGLNMVFRAGSGVPYSRIKQAQADLISAQDTRFRVLAGEINGSRLPWQFKVDAKLDKTFELTSANAENKGRESNINIYLQIQNLLNFKNIINVYDATGNPDDDGYLSTNQGREFIKGQTDQTAFVDQYNVRLNDPFNYSLPRTIRLGAIYSF